MTSQILLDAHELPRQWYNLAADLTTPLLPPLGPDGKPVSAEALAAIFPGPLLEQEMSTKRWIDIPEEVLEILARWRPVPLCRALGLEKALKTPARIYFKNESISPAGSHKVNTAVAQAYYNRVSGIKKIVTETGAGQWGSSMSFASTLMGMKCKVYMVRSSFEQKPYRRMMMEVWGGSCVASPSTQTKAGREALARDPNTPGSLGMAISEAIEETLSDPKKETRYALGSVLNHVLLHQTIIGLEAKKQLLKAGERLPDLVIGCVGGGSNFAGLAFPFVADKLSGRDIALIPVEPQSCPTLTRTPLSYDFGDVAGLTPLLPMHSLGHGFVSSPIHAGGLRYHGMAPLVSKGVAEGLFTPRAYPQSQCYEAAVLWARTEGVIPAPETSHAIAAVIEEATKAREEGRERVILFNFSGHGLLDLAGYEAYQSGKMQDYVPTDAEIAGFRQPLSAFPQISKNGTGESQTSAPEI
jgi:tryptophan synthase beta chain